MPKDLEKRRINNREELPESEAPDLRPLPENKNRDQGRIQEGYDAQGHEAGTKSGNRKTVGRKSS